MKHKIELRKVNQGNIDEVLTLKVAMQQKSFVAPVEKSLAYAYAFREVCQPYGIYYQQQLVGYILLIFDLEDQMYNIWHFLIDEQQQGKGYGKQALVEALAIMKADGKSKQVALTVEEDNYGAKRLYEAVGFYDTLRREENELVLFYEFKE